MFVSSIENQNITINTITILFPVKVICYFVVIISDLGDVDEMVLPLWLSVKSDIS